MELLDHVVFWSPVLIAVIVWGALRDRTMKKCPKCAEMIKREAMVCRYCHYELTANDDLRMA